MAKPKKSGRSNGKKSAPKAAKNPYNLRSKDIARKSAAKNRKTPAAKGYKNVRAKARENLQKAKQTAAKQALPVSSRKPSSSANILEDIRGPPFSGAIRQPIHKFEDLGGLDSIKEELMDAVIRPFANPVRSADLKLSVPRGILFTGKPGTGKTALADGIVNELKKKGMKVTYFVETGQSLSKYFGESEQNIRTLFSNAKAHAPSIIFLDEIDGIGKKRATTEPHLSTVLTTLLSEINNVERGKVLLIGATNCSENVDPALIRKGRFDETYKIPSPNDAGRRQILEVHINKLGLNIGEEMLDELVDRSASLVGSDLESLVKTLHRNAIKRIFPNGSWDTAGERDYKRLRQQVTEIQRGDFEEVLAEIQMERNRSGNSEE